MVHVSAEPPAGRANAQHERDVALAALAGRQHGVVSRSQLHELGFSGGHIDRMLRRARLHRVRRAVFALGHPMISTEGRLVAATLAVGRGSVISYRSAGVLWGIRESRRVSIDVTVSTNGRRPPADIDLHQVRQIPTRDLASVRGVPVTAVSRTIADLAAVISRGDLARTLERADSARLLDPPSVLRAARRRPGAPVLRALLQETASAPSRSELEDRLVALLARHSLPAPEVNVRLHGIEVDLLWREQRVVVEADGHEFHAFRTAIERDRRRDALLARHGYRVLRFTWQQVSARPLEVTRALERALAGR